MRYSIVLITVIALSPSNAGGEETKPQSAESFAWQQLPPLPDREGFAGPYAGVSGGALLVAGGANFPEKPPWAGGAKVWYDRIYILAAKSGKWRVAREKLPRPLAYGGSITFKDAVICLGGDDGKRHYADVFLLRWGGRRVTRVVLPKMPQPAAHCCAALVGNTIYVAGGIDSPGATRAMKTFWALDLSKLDLTPEGKNNKTQRVKGTWRKLPPWPGSERTQAIAASIDGKFYLFGGLRLTKDRDGKPKRIAPYLRDAYAYTPGGGGGAGVWRKLAKLPRPAAAAPSPAPTLGKTHVAILGGVDGSLLTADPAKHPGFTREILLYDTRRDRWTRRRAIPPGASRVTVPTTRWQNRWIIPSGERRPGLRSPRVYSLSPSSTREHK